MACKHSLNGKLWQQEADRPGTKKRQQDKNIEPKLGDQPDPSKMEETQTAEKTKLSFGQTHGPR